MIKRTVIRVLSSLAAGLIPLSLAVADDNAAGLPVPISAAADSAGQKVWIQFIDKDDSPVAFGKAAAKLAPRALQRRHDIPPDWYDLPVRQEYVEAVGRCGGREIRVSRWLNAVSCRLTAPQITCLQAYPFVKSIAPVLCLTRHLEPSTEVYDKAAIIDSLAYGPSYTQNRMLGIDRLHQKFIPVGADSLRLNGSGVLLAFFDTGFLPHHPAFDSIRILATWDFINNDSTVDDNQPTASQKDHGTATLSACGGFSFGNLIGPAFGADYILAKTELFAQEIRIEEDYWVMAAEWADSLGADIISSSLGYDNWYTYADMNGHTAVTTIASDIAASRGILVVTAAGNEALHPWHYIIAPADADSVVAVGAIGANGVIADFSSFGPTADGRIKPEVVAMGLGVRCADYLGGFKYASGTSLATPQIAGAAALILQANPWLRGRPGLVRRRLIAAGDRFSNPDNQYGYGLPDMVDAADSRIWIRPIPQVTVIAGQDTTVAIETFAPIGETVQFSPIDFPSNIGLVDLGNGLADLNIHGSEGQEGIRDYRLIAAAADGADTLDFSVLTVPHVVPFVAGPNPFADSLTFFFTGDCPERYAIDVFTLSGEVVYRYTGQVAAGPFTWPGVNAGGEKVASGVYLIRFSADGIEERIKVLKL